MAPEGRSPNRPTRPLRCAVGALALLAVLLWAPASTTAKHGPTCFGHAVTIRGTMGRDNIDLGKYSGWYAVRDEAYYGEDELTTGAELRGQEPGLSFTTRAGGSRPPAP